MSLPSLVFTLPAIGEVGLSKSSIVRPVILDPLKEPSKVNPIVLFDRMEARFLSAVLLCPFRLVK